MPTLRERTGRPLHHWPTFSNNHGQQERTIHFERALGMLIYGISMDYLLIIYGLSMDYLWIILGAIVQKTLLVVASQGISEPNPPKSREFSREESPMTTCLCHVQNGIHLQKWREGNGNGHGRRPHPPVPCMKTTCKPFGNSIDQWMCLCDIFPPG